MDAAANFAVDLGRVSRRWRARLDERLRYTGLTQARWLALLHLSRSGPVSQRELAESMGIEGPTLVRLLDRLERQNLISRRECGTDRRVKEVHLTEDAAPLLEEITRITVALRNELLDDVPAADLVVAARVVKTIADKLEGNFK